MGDTASIEVIVDLEASKVGVRIEEIPVELALTPEIARDLAFQLTLASIKVEEG